MSSEADILSRIAKLSGVIKQHKEEQSSNQGGHETFRGRSASRGRGRGRGRGSPNMALSNVSQPTASSSKNFAYHRSLANAPYPANSYTPQRFPSTSSPHRKLVLNGASASSPLVPDHSPSTLEFSPHRKLVINHKDAQSTPTTPTSVVRSVNALGQHIVTINGANFVAKGKKLIREDCLNSNIPHGKGPKVLIRKTIKSKRRRDKNKNMVLGNIPKPPIPGRKHLRSKKGNMVFIREPEGYVRQGRSGKSLVLKSSQQRTQYCGIFTRYGKCPNRTRCPFEHDPSHRAICPRFLQKRCQKPASLCRLSHEPTPFIMPHCVHFQRGRCKNESCQFTHVGVRSDAPICRAFAMEGYCPKGVECHNKHVHVCPEFAEMSKCSNANCRLPHVAQKTEEKSTKMTGVVRPGSWVSADYFRAQKMAKALKHKDKAGTVSATPIQTSNVQPKNDDLPPKQDDEEDFVRLFDDSDDEGWSQFQLKDEDDTNDIDSLRFSDGDDDNSEDEHEEDGNEDDYEDEDDEGEGDVMEEGEELSDNSLEDHEGEHEMYEEVYEEASDDDEHLKEANS